MSEEVKNVLNKFRTGRLNVTLTLFPYDTLVSKKIIIKQNGLC